MLLVVNSDKGLIKAIGCNEKEEVVKNVINLALISDIINNNINEIINLKDMVEKIDVTVEEGKSLATCIIEQDRICAFMSWISRNNYCRMYTVQSSGTVCYQVLEIKYTDYSNDTDMDKWIQFIW